MGAMNGRSRCTTERMDSRSKHRPGRLRSEEHTSELQSRLHLVCRLLLEKKKNHTTFVFRRHRHFSHGMTDEKHRSIPIYSDYQPPRTPTHRTDDPYCHLRTDPSPDTSV